MIDSILSKTETLFFIRMDGCEACEAAMPEVDKFTSKHPRTMVLTIDANGPIPDQLGVNVRATPTWVFRRGQDAVVKVGFMKVTEIEKWIKHLGGTL